MRLLSPEFVNALPRTHPKHPSESASRFSRASSTPAGAASGR
jgi:hypothetical protein